MTDKPSWILMRVETGDIYHQDGGGKWYTPSRWRYLTDSEDMEIAFESERALTRYLESGPEVWQVLFTGVSWVVDEGGWTDSGFDYGCAWVEYESFKIVPHDWEPTEHGLEPGKLLGVEND